MKLFAVRSSVLAAMGLAVAAGCARKSPPPAPLTRPAVAPAPLDASAGAASRSRDISRLVDEYSQLSHQLPGRTAEEHRQVVRDALSKMDAILSLLSDPHNDLGMSQNLAALEEARDRLGNDASPETVAAATDSGLRSAYNALGRIARDKDFQDQDLSEPMKDFGARLDELDTVHSLTHQVVVAEAVDASVTVVSKMADLIASKVAPASGGTATTEPTTGAPVTAAPATQPAPDAAATPATQPAPDAATAPATAPATPALPAALPASAPATQPQ